MRAALGGDGGGCRRAKGPTFILSFFPSPFFPFFRVSIFLALSSTISFSLTPFVLLPCSLSSCGQPSSLFFFLAFFLFPFPPSIQTVLSRPDAYLSTLFFSCVYRVAIPSPSTDWRAKEILPLPGSETFFETLEHFPSFLSTEKLPPSLVLPSPLALGACGTLSVLYASAVVLGFVGLTCSPSRSFLTPKNAPLTAFQARLQDGPLGRFFFFPRVEAPYHLVAVAALLVGTFYLLPSFVEKHTNAHYLLAPYLTLVVYVSETRLALAYYVLLAPVLATLTYKLTPLVKSTTIRRKIHHLSMALLLVPAPWCDTSLYFAVAGCLLIAVEAYRFVCHPTKVALVTSLYDGVLNATDETGTQAYKVIVSPLTLLYGCVAPAVVSGNFVPALLICAGDSAAAIVGSAFGTTTYKKLFGPKFNNRTVTGTVAFLLACLIPLCLFRFFTSSLADCFVNDVQGVLLCSLLEAFADDNDNAMLAALGWAWWSAAETSSAA